MLNSARFVANALMRARIPAKVVEVTDNNDIDREVTAFCPTHAIVEAIWVVPEKFAILKRLHPKVKWIIRIHSRMPFLASEGVAMEWISRYHSESQIEIASNHKETAADLSDLFGFKIGYLPNIRSVKLEGRGRPRRRGLDIGCFGAIRPLKNQLQQAVAAIRYANKTNRRLRFHVNSGRIEQSGEQVIRNLVSLFAQDPKHYLVEHPWYSHAGFMEVVSSMDIHMQVSYSESFNIVTADAVSAGVPCVTSSDISWASPLFYADPNSVRSIVGKLRKAEFLGRTGNWINRNRLVAYNAVSLKTWLRDLTPC